ncbi:MAG: protein kinase [Tepidisphaeraceae bacterium]
MSPDTHKISAANQPTMVPLPVASGPVMAILGAAQLALPKVPGYDVQSFLGRGGMGDVYRAVQMGTRRPVALKIMRPDFVSEKLRLRFDREVELTARLDHPNIARIYDSGRHEAIYFYAMELIEGEAIDKHVSSNALPRRAVLELMRTVVRAVQHAHQRGVIHRDLTPNNILVGADGQPHVLDFGLAKPLLDEAAPMISVSREVIGTPAMMSPEQAAGENGRIDTRTDVYSLGVMLFRFLTGHWPHDISGPEHEVLRRIRNEEVIRPRDFLNDIDRDLEALLLKALARLPEDRYASAAEFAHDLDNYLSGDPITARRASVWYVLRKRVKKHAPAAAIVAVAALLATAVAVAFFPIFTAALGLLALVFIVSIAFWGIKHERDQVVVQRNRTQALLRINELMNRKQELSDLLELLLAEARLLCAADAGTLFIRDGEELQFTVAQNQTLRMRLGSAAVADLFKPFRLPISDRSVAGYVALSGKLVNLPDAQQISPRLPFHYNPDFDRRHDYQTRSMLAVPVRDPDGALLGVLQLINRTSAVGKIVPFTSDDESLMTSLASLAAVALRYRQLRSEPGVQA